MRSKPSDGQLVAVIGRGVLEADEPLAYADSLGLTRGDGCFDATVVFAAQSRDGSADGSDSADGPGAGSRHVLHLDLHIERLGRSAAALGIHGPHPHEWSDLVTHAVVHWLAPEAESMLKLVLERGREDHPSRPLAYLTVTPLPESTFTARQGIAVASMSGGRSSDAFADAPWLLGGVKTIAYAANLAAKREAERRGADDALWVSTDGYALEAPTAALIVRYGEELVTTPTGPTGVLASITARTLFDAAQGEGLSCDHRLMRLEEVFESDGAWLVSSVRGIAPIYRLDEREVAFDQGWHQRITELAGFQQPTGCLLPGTHEEG